MQTVLLTAPYMLPSIKRFLPVLTHYGLEVIAPEVEERFEEEDILKYAGKFDATICGDDRYTRRVIEHCLPRLKVISKWGTGIDSIDQEACRELGVQVKNTPNAFTLPVADTVIGYMLAFARRLPAMDRAMKKGEWQKIPGRSLSECTLGVIGLGNVGKAVIRRASPFGMRILGNDIVTIAPDFILENHVEMTSLKDLLQQADFVSMNTDLNPTSFHLVNRETLLWIKPGAVLINTSRGPVVNEKDLVEALQTGKLGGAALDVFEHEPLPQDSPLLQMENVLLAPHNSNSSPAAWERVHWNTIKNLLIGLNISDTDLEQWSNKI
ncbi:MAG: phosphoglycerate dehydrogenase [Anaerolineaceae bacterium]